ncbi:hypothetical protein GTY65_30950 [Streptomyces sp. SID8379]|uniref:hypothetical protein n=1 Tax=unclassified Streptomyces TaxID=2593676 RepID=UPI00131A2CFC|nr:MULTISPECIES: hypothetical protein [unclassified Streptomyces]MYW68461.1 hypothetical protein [Streptomyces sp. SID8379]
MEMKTVTIRLRADELDAVRRRAEAQGKSLQAHMHDTLLAESVEADRLLRRSVRDGVARYAEAFAEADRENDRRLAARRAADCDAELEPGEW